MIFVKVANSDALTFSLMYGLINPIQLINISFCLINFFKFLSKFFFKSNLINLIFLLFMFLKKINFLSEILLLYVWNCYIGSSRNTFQNIWKIMQHYATLRKMIQHSTTLYKTKHKYAEWRNNMKHYSNLCNVIQHYTKSYKVCTNYTHVTNLYKLIQNH